MEEQTESERIHSLEKNNREGGSPRRYSTVIRGVPEGVARKAQTRADRLDEMKRGSR